MSSASLAHTHTPFVPSAPDRVRIAALATALALNLAVLLVALRPLPPAMFTALQSSPRLQIRWIDTPPPSPPPPPIQLQPLPAPATPVVAPASPAPVVVPISATDEGTVAPQPAVQPVAPAIAPAQAVTPPAPIAASLAYRAAPLRFPTVAIRRHMHGTVVLRVLVDTQGRPLQVIVEHGSGYPLLDRSAREQVLASWRFEPAQLGGQAVSAWARVPVTFDLRDL